MNPIDCMGLSCPQPVLKTRAYLMAHPETTELIVWVDNAPASENVKRFLENQGFTVSIEAQSERFIVSAIQGCELPIAMAGTQSQAVQDEDRTLVVLTRDKMGKGDEVLGHKLMINFINTLPEMGQALWRIVCLNSGVALTIEGSEALPGLKKLVEQGISLFVCGTCLNHYGLIDKKRVGETTNMLDIVISMQHADKIITI